MSGLTLEEYAAEKVKYQEMRSRAASIATTETNGGRWKLSA